MAIKLNWDTLADVRSGLEKTWDLKPDSKVVFVLLMRNGSHHKKVINFSDFLKFFWFIYDNTNFYVKGLVVTDTSGRILYRHRQVTSKNEKIPHGGNTHIFERWPEMSQAEKDVHLSILLSQLYDHSESSRKPLN